MVTVPADHFSHNNNDITIIIIMLLWYGRREKHPLSTSAREKMSFLLPVGYSSVLG